MGIQTAFGTALKTAAATIALIGQRSYWATSPQDPTFPLIMFQVTGQQPFARELRGANSILQSTIQITAASKSSMDEATAIADALVLDFDNQRATIGPVVIKSCQFVNRWDDPRHDQQLFCSVVQFELVHS